MFYHLFWFCLCLFPMDLIKSSNFCGEPIIDSIGYSSDKKMYFISRGGHYWWISEDELPPKGEGEKLPTPFLKATAAVYINSDKGCPLTETRGLRPREQELWIIGKTPNTYESSPQSTHMMISFDTKYNTWGKPEPIHKDRCLAKTRIDLSSNNSIDAMFAINYLEIFLVQKNRYAMVNCSFICDESSTGYGSDKPNNNITDWNITAPIHGMYSLMNEETKENSLVIFHSKTFSILKIKSIVNGKIIAKKESEADILTTFLKFNESQCPKGTDTPGKKPTEDPGNENSSPFSERNPTDPGNGDSDTSQSDGENSSDDDSVGGFAIFILIAMFVIILIVSGIGVFLLLSLRDNQREQEEHTNSDNKLHSNVKHDPNPTPKSLTKSPSDSTKEKPNPPMSPKMNPSDSKSQTDSSKTKTISPKSPRISSVISNDNKK